MKESYEQGLANHSAPTSTLRRVTSWVLHGQGVHAGQVLSSEISTFRVPTLSNCGEGNMRHDVNGELWRDAAESKTLRMCGNSRRESREIPSVSSSVDGERPEKASGRTSGMHAGGKSDGSIVPAKRANKTGTPAAETVEEREPPKGNDALHVPEPDTVPDPRVTLRRVRLRLVAMSNIVIVSTQGRSRMG